MIPHASEYGLRLPASASCNCTRILLAAAQQQLPTSATGGGRCCCSPFHRPLACFPGGFYALYFRSLCRQCRKRPCGKAGRADRLELCADLIIGGTTPSLALVRQVKAETGLPVRALLRPRFGDFCYDRYELATDG